MLLLVPAGACSFTLQDDSGDSGGGVHDPRGNCGKLSLLRDDFNDMSPSYQWTVHGTAGVSEPEELGGMLVINIVEPDEDGRYESRNAYDLRGAGLTVEVPEVAGLAYETELRLAGVRGAGLEPDEISISFYQDELSFIVQPGGQEKQELATIPYDATSHRFWSFTEDGGDVLFQTAPAQSGPWTTQARTPFLQSFDQVVASLRMDDHDVSAGGESAFDNLNAGAASSMACPAAGFVDDFGDQQIDRFWGQTDLADCVASEGADGVLDIEAPGGDDCVFDLAPAVSLVGSSVTLVFENPALGSADSDTFLELRRSDDEVVFMDLSDGVLEASADQVGSNLEPLTAPLADLGEARLWRVSGVGGSTVRFEYSADGKTWTRLGQLTVDFPLDELGLDLGVEGDGGHARIEGLNTL